MQARRVLSLVAIGATALISANAAQAAGNSASTTANINARVAAAISILKTADMSFGDFTNDVAACTLVLSPSTGAVSVTAGACSPLAGGANPAAAAGFTVNGEGNHKFSVTLPGANVTLSDGAGHTLTVNTFTMNPVGAPAGVLQLAVGTTTFNVGASLTTVANQVAGNYTGTFSVTVTYQ